MEAGKTFTSLSKSRGTRTLKELVREVTTMTKVSKEDMMLVIDWITGGIADLNNALRQFLATGIRGGFKGVHSAIHDDSLLFLTMLMLYLLDITLLSFACGMFLLLVTTSGIRVTSHVTEDAVRTSMSGTKGKVLKPLASEEEHMAYSGPAHAEFSEQHGEDIC